MCCDITLVGDITLAVEITLEGGNCPLGDRWWGKQTMKLDTHMLLCVTCVTGREKIQGQGITADEVTGRRFYLLLSTGPTQEGRDD